MLTFDFVPPLGKVRSGAAGHVVVLHGLGDDRHGWKAIAEELDLPGLGWCFVQAPVPYGPGFSWFDLDWEHDMRPDPAGVASSAIAVHGLIDHLIAERGVEADRLAIMGFSQGCLMALELALTGQRRFAAVVGISGWIHGMARFPGGFGSPAREQRILLTHGRQDEVVRISLTKPQVAPLQAMGIHLTWREYAKAHGLDPQRELGDIRTFLTERLAVGGP